MILNTVNLILTKLLDCVTIWVSKSVAAPKSRLHRAYVDILYAEKLINEATDVSQLDYVDAVLNHISLDGGDRPLRTKFL